MSCDKLDEGREQFPSDSNQPLRLLTSPSTTPHSLCLPLLWWSQVSYGLRYWFSSWTPNTLPYLNWNLNCTWRHNWPQKHSYLPLSVLDCSASINLYFWIQALSYLLCLRPAWHPTCFGKMWVPGQPFSPPLLIHLFSLLIPWLHSPLTPKTTERALYNLLYLKLFYSKVSNLEHSFSDCKHLISSVLSMCSSLDPNHNLQVHTALSMHSSSLAQASRTHLSSCMLVCHSHHGSSQPCAAPLLTCIRRAKSRHDAAGFYWKVHAISSWLDLCAFYSLLSSLLNSLLISE